jgi:hypothetical protein
VLVAGEDLTKGGDTRPVVATRKGRGERKVKGRKGKRRAE